MYQMTTQKELGNFAVVIPLVEIIISRHYKSQFKEVHVEVDFPVKRQVCFLSGVSVWMVGYPATAFLHWSCITSSQLASCWNNCGANNNEWGNDQMC